MTLAWNQKHVLSVRIPPGEHRRTPVHYESRDGTFTAHLDVDDEGLVVRYGDVWGAGDELMTRTSRARSRSRRTCHAGRRAPLVRRVAACALLALLCTATACARPRTDIPAEPVRAVVISDLNASYGSTHYAREVGVAVRHIVETWRPDVVLIAGDMVAGQSPQLADTTVAAMWEAFDSAVAAPLRAAGIPVIATPGNHDASAYPAHRRDRRMAVEYWRSSPATTAQDSLLDRAHYPLRYTVRYGNVFIASWDATNQESATSDELVSWLQEKLRSPEARAADHRVVLGHLPLYAVAAGRDRPGEVLARGDALRRQLEQWGATLFISGHHHAYYPGRRGTLELLHSGALGGGPRQLLGTGTPPLKTVTLLEFFPDSLDITTFQLSADDDRPEMIAIEALPRAICGSSGWVARRDLVALDTTCTTR